MSLKYRDQQSIEYPDRAHLAAHAPVIAATIGYMESLASNFDLLQWLSADARAAFLAAVHVRRYPADTIIYLKGQVGTNMYRIASGVVRMLVMSSDGREAVYLHFHAGDCFGITSFLDGEPYPQTAVSSEETELQVLSGPAFAALRRDFREIDDGLLRLLARMIRHASALYADSHLNNLRTRIAQRLVDAAHAEVGHRQRQRSVELRLSQAEIGSMVGVSRQSVNRSLKRFQSEQSLAVKNGVIVIRDLLALERIAALR
jgi:CRP/FNR family transcriptional regulator, cyclic AMP receptor protein